MRKFSIYIPRLNHAATEADIEKLVCLLHKRTAVSIPDREYWKLREHPKVKERINQRINECLRVQFKLSGIVDNQVTYALSRLGKSATSQEVDRVIECGDKAKLLLDSAVRSLSNGVSWRHVADEKSKADSLLVIIYNTGRKS